MRLGLSMRADWCFRGIPDPRENLEEFFMDVVRGGEKHACVEF